jgi:RNA ligase
MEELFDLNAFWQQVDDKYITVRPHPTDDLLIANYTPLAQYASHWTPETLQSRGLIFRGDGEVVARPWKKFFNLGERNQTFQFDDPVEVYDKLDGSLGILYPSSTGPAIATRGSFTSEQAVHATQVLRSKYPNVGAGGPWTFLFEIVYPTNRIVLDYGQMDDLVLLGAVEKREGYYLGPNTAAGLLNWSGPVAEQLPHRTLSEALGDTERANAEGFVVKYHNTLVKIKQPDYLELHKLRFETTPLRIWEALAAGRSVQEIVAPLPDEFRDELLEISNSLLIKYHGVYSEIELEWSAVNGLVADRKEFALAAAKMTHKTALFRKLDGKDYDDYIWKQIRPHANEKELV